jgi:hypothetical protein
MIKHIRENSEIPSRKILDLIRKNSYYTQKGVLMKKKDNELEQKVTTSCKEMSGWIKFLAIAWIVTGCIYALTIVGIVLIWIGIILLRVSKSCRGIADGTYESLGDMFASLKTFFILTGVFTIITIALSIIWFMIVGIAMVGGFLGEAGGLY